MRPNAPCPSRKSKMSTFFVSSKRPGGTSIKRRTSSASTEKRCIGNWPRLTGSLTNNPGVKPRRRTFLYEAAGILVVSAGIFLLDVFTPNGWAVWLLYLLPLLITFDSPRVRHPIYFGSLFSVLTILGFVLSPA